MKTIRFIQTISCVIILLIGTSTHLCAQKVAKISGILNTESKSMFLSYNGVESMLGRQRDIEIKGDSKGAFSIEVPLDRPRYYRLSRNTLYLSPGDNLRIVIDEDAGKSMFSGKGEEANSYLKDRLFPKAGSFLCAGQYAYHTLDSLRDYVNEESSRRLKKLNNLKGVSTSFKELETARIKADIINSYLSFPSYYKPFWKMRKNGLAENDLEKLSNELIAPAIPEIQKLFKEINQDRFLDVEVVRDVFGSVLDKPEIKGNIVYSNRATELFATIEKSSVLSDNPTKENIEDIKAYANTMKSADFKQELLKKVASVGHLLKGFKAFDIQLEDINGKKYQLSDFKGKYLYVDFWATWCGPCNYESPFFEKLNKEINSSQILFVSVSTDTSEQAWKEYLKKNNRDGLQFRTKDNSIYKNWMINGIPRFLLIDKDFNIINAFADRPSTAEAKAALLKLLDK